jgi:hypothetical protein
MQKILRESAALLNSCNGPPDFADEAAAHDVRLTVLHG